MNKFYLLPLFVFGLILGLSAQHQNVMISNSNGPNEPCIYMNPKNTDQLIAGANTDKLFYSEDGGYTWTVTTLFSPTNGVWGDPVTIVDTAENYYYFHLSNPSSGNFIDRIVCQKSTDFGQTWNDGSYMGLNGEKVQDKHWVVVDRTNNNMYATWTEFDIYGAWNPGGVTDADSSRILFSKSTDAGLSWSQAKRINEVCGDVWDSDGTTEGAVPAVGPNGEIYVAWAGPEGLTFDRSTDQGETWLDEDIFVDDFPGGWDYEIPGISRCNGLPITVCDLSGGSHHGNIYINWTDQGNGLDDTDVWMAKSTDGGDTWSGPIRVNDDPPGKQQFFTWMTIDQITGYLWFVWYDRRNYDDTNTDVYMAVSMDGGETFINFKVSEEPFIPNAGTFFGDYNCVHAHNNVVRPIWTRMHNNQRSAYTAIVDPDAVIVTDITQHDLQPYAEIQPNFPNPFTETTVIAFKLLNPGKVSLRVFDMFGKEVAVLVDNEYRSLGKYEEHFVAYNYDLSSGVYYFSLTGEGINLQRKMMLVK